MRAILMFHSCEGQSHKTVSTDHNFWRKRRAEAVSNRGPSAYQPNALPLGQSGSRLLLLLMMIAFILCYSRYRADSLRSYAILNEWLAFAARYFWVSTEMMYLQRCSVVTWLVPHETAAVSAHVPYTPYNHAPVYCVTSIPSHTGTRMWKSDMGEKLQWHPHLWLYSLLRKTV